MHRKAILIGAVVAAAAASPSVAQSWGFGVTVGGPAYYEGQIYQRALPLSPDAVFDALEAAGYREFSPMAPRGPIFKLNAVNRRGDLVALEVSAFTGEVERERIIALSQRPPLRALRRSAPPPLVAPEPPPQQAPADEGARNPLVVY